MQIHLNFFRTQTNKIKIKKSRVIVGGPFSQPPALVLKPKFID